MLLRKLFLHAIGLTMLGLVIATNLALSQDIRTADVAHDQVNKISLGLFNWKQDSNSNMIASFVMSNYGDRDISELTISCDYTVSTANGQRKIERVLKDEDLATTLAGEFMMRAHSGRHYIDINFGVIEPVKTIRYMACKITDAKF